MALKTTTIKQSGPSGEALDKLIKSLGAVVQTKVPVPSGEAITTEKLLAVEVWQQVTYLVRCLPSEVSTKISDPLERLAKVGEGDVPGSGIIEVRDATMEDLEKAIPTKALVI